MIKRVIRKLYTISGKKQTKAASSYIPAEETIRNAAAENLPVCDYLEKLWNQQGQTDMIIDRIDALTQLPPQPAVLEIGTGTGRYLEKTLKKINPVEYESYEIAEDWNDYLRSQYKNVKVFQADGASLSKTVDKSIDMVMAHGVFVYLPFLISMGYFNEINRVTRAGGYCIFDCFTETCFKSPYLDNWLQSKHNYPVLLPEDFTKKIFVDLGFHYVDGFINKYGEGISQYLVFQKKS